VLMVLVQHRVTSPARFVLEGRRVVILGVSLDPVVETLTRYPEHPGDVDGGATVVELQYGESASIQAHILRIRELTSKALPLPPGQVETTHGLPLHRST